MSEDNQSPKLPGRRHGESDPIPASPVEQDTQASMDTVPADPRVAPKVEDTQERKALFVDEVETQQVVPAPPMSKYALAENVPADAAPPMSTNVDEPVSLRHRWLNRRAALAARRSSVRLTRISPWGAGLTALFCSVVLASAVEGLVYLTWKLFDSAGIFDKIVAALVPAGGEGATTLQSWLTLDKFLTVGGVFALSLLILVPVFIFFAAITFNLTSKITGGVRITLTGDK